MTDVFPDWHFARFPTPAMAFRHEQHRARQLRFKRVALPVPMPKVAAFPKPVEAIKPPEPPPVPTCDFLAVQFAAAHEMVERAMRASVYGIQRVVAANYRVTVHDIISHRRVKEIVRPRMVAVYLAKQICVDKSYPELGRLFGGRDHSTIYHSVNKMAELMAKDAELAQRVMFLKEQIIGSLDTEEPI